MWPWMRLALPIRLGAEEVYVLYRRSFEEIPARQEEVQHAQEEQIQFQTLTNPGRDFGAATTAM